MNSRTLIIIPIYNQEKFINKSLPLLKSLDKDILLIDDGSTDDTYSVIKEYRWIKYIKHEQNLGSGASFISAYQYARDLEYELMVTMDPRNIKFKEEITRLMDNYKYGYDVVTSSRILENYDYQMIPRDIISITEQLSAALKDITGFDLTDPLSGIKAVRTESLQNMELTEFNHGLFLQLWIQAHYFGLTILEIPAQSGNGFGEELSLYDDPLSMFMSIIDTEKCLYSKDSIN